MKKIIIIFLLFLTIEAKSQTSIYHPFPSANAIWNMEFYGNQMMGCSGFIPDAIYSHAILGDSIYNNLSYHKVYSKITNYFGGSVLQCGPFYCPPTFNSPYFQLNYNGYIGAIREDTVAKEVYFLASDSVSELLLYQFDLQQGEYLKASYFFDTTTYVQTIDSFFDGVGYRKKFILKIAQGNFYGEVIEGMEVIDKIAAVEKGANDRPKQDIRLYCKIIH